MSQTFWTSLMRVPFRLGYVQAGGVSTRYLEAGEGPALVLIHGAGAHLEVFLPVVPLLAQGRRVIAYDMVGHGLSAKPPVDYTTEVLSAHLHAGGSRRVRAGGSLLLGVGEWVPLGRILCASPSEWPGCRRRGSATPGTLLLGVATRGRPWGPTPRPAREELRNLPPGFRRPSFGLRGRSAPEVRGYRVRSCYRALWRPLRGL